MEPSLLDALQAAVASAPVNCRPAEGLHHIAIAGATGRLGEAFINAALSRSDVQRVTVLVRQPFSQAPPKLVGRDPDQWLRGEMPNALVLLPSANHDGLTRLGNARDAVYADLVADLFTQSLAHDLRATHLLVVHPVAAWQQLGAFQQGLAGPLEEQAAASNAASVTIVRPVLSSTVRAASWLQRLINGYLSIQLLMMPRSVPTLTSAQIARRSLDLLAERRDGVRIFGAADL